MLLILRRPNEFIEITEKQKMHLNNRCGWKQVLQYWDGPVLVYKNSFNIINISNTCHWVSSLF